MIATNLSDLLGREVTRKDLYLKKVIIKDGVENICPNCLWRIKRMESIVLPNSVVKIETFSFRNCQNLKAIEIPESVEEIGPYAFSGCFSLESIVVDKNNPAFDSRDNCNAIIRKKDNVLALGCKNTIIPNGVKRIGAGAFKSCTDMESLYIPESLTQLYNYTFPFHGELMSIVVDEKNRFYDSRENCNAIIRKSSNTLIYGCNTSTIPNSIVSIDFEAFKDCSKIKSIVIPEGLVSIDEHAFDGCSNLSSITLPNSLTYIGKGAFHGCKRSKVFNIPKGTKEKFASLLPQYERNLKEEV